MTDNPIEAYQQTQVQTTSREQVLLKLYDGVIEFMHEGAEALEEDQFERAHNKLIRSQRIVTELMATLNMEVGGEIAEELYGLYSFVHDQLVDANMDKDPGPVRDAIPIMEELNEAWIEVIEEKGMTIQKAKKIAGKESPLTQNPDSADSGDTDSQTAETNNSGNSDEGDSGTSGSDVTYGDEQEDVTYGDVSFRG